MPSLPPTQGHRLHYLLLLLVNHHYYYYYYFIRPASQGHWCHSQPLIAVRIAPLFHHPALALCYHRPPFTLRCLHAISIRCSLRISLDPLQPLPWPHLALSADLLTSSWTMLVAYRAVLEHLRVPHTRMSLPQFTRSVRSIYELHSQTVQYSHWGGPSLYYVSIFRQQVHC